MKKKKKLEYRELIDWFFKLQTYLNIWKNDKDVKVNYQIKYVVLTSCTHRL